MQADLLSRLENRKITLGSYCLAFCKNINEQKELYEIFLDVIKEGTSYPQLIPFSFEEFLNYFFPQNAKVLICTNNKKEITGGCYIKTNFPGRSSHIANCGYIVKKECRGQGIGFHLGKYSIDIARELGYRSIIFNLVFKENISSVKLWEKLGFEIIGTIPKAVKKDDGGFQDAYIMFLKIK